MIVPYSTWAHRPARSTPPTIPLPAPELYLHHGAGGVSSIQTARGYLNHHLDGNGWSAIGYQFLIAEGRVLEGRGAGRQGAQVAGRNLVSQGICLVGDYTSTVPAGRDLDALAWLLDHGRRQGWWTVTELTGGHRDAPGATTTCPGHALQARIPDINRRARLLRSGGTPTQPTPEDDMPLTDEDIDKIVNKLLYTTLPDPYTDEDLYVATLLRQGAGPVREVRDSLGGRNIADDMRRLRRSLRPIGRKLGIPVASPEPVDRIET